MPETGSLSEDEIAAILERPPDPADNRPARVPHHAGVGNSPTVSREESLRRRLAMAQVLSNGWGVDEIVRWFGLPGDEQGFIDEAQTQRAFALSENATRALIQQVLEMWAEEDVLLSPHKKRIAVRRTLQEIRDARRNKHFTAVAALEKNLMALEGTAAPVKVEATLRVTGAIAGILGEMTEEELVRLIGSEVERDGARLAPGQVLVVDHRPEPGARLPAPRREG